MTFSKMFAIFTCVLFGVIGVAALVKGFKTEDPTEIVEQSPAVETVVVLEEVVQPATMTTPGQPEATPQVAAAAKPIPIKPRHQKAGAPLEAVDDQLLPNASRVDELFTVKGSTLPIVETITYKSRVAWQKGRPAWLSDYASHYKTSRHFIARSLNGKPDYFKQDVADGDRFNVFKEGKNISFYLLVDSSRFKMWLYSLEGDSNERTLLKRYDIGLGREDSSKASGCLTPLGKYGLGSKVAIYKPTMMGHHNGQKVEMVRVFGTRWIPFEKEISACSAPAKGFGIHGVPWINGPGAGGIVEDKAALGKRRSDGCIWMSTQDIEELFAIIITKPTVIEIVSDFYDAELPGKEKTQRVSCP